MKVDELIEDIRNWPDEAKQWVNAVGSNSIKINGVHFYKKRQQ